jgi:hypothetical protein
LETVSKSHKTGQDALSPRPRERFLWEQGHPALDMHAKISFLANLSGQKHAVE